MIHKKGDATNLFKNMRQIMIKKNQQSKVIYII